jgi:hypothetical protein
LIKRNIHEKNLTVVNTHALNIGTLNLIKEALLDIKVQIDPNTIVSDFNTSLSLIDW